MKRIALLVVAIMLSAAAYAQVDVGPMPVAKHQFFDSAGKPVSLGYVCTYAAGTTTPLATYTDYTGTVANATCPTATTGGLQLDAGGFANIWLGPYSYKIVLQNSSRVVQWTVDGVRSLSTMPWITAASALGDTVYVDATPKFTRLAGNTTAHRKYLGQTGTGAVSAAPAWYDFPMYDVQIYGAVCDGTTDVTANVQAALDAITAALGGVVYFPNRGCSAGGYKFGALTMPATPHGYITFLSDADWTLMAEIDWLNSDTAIIGRAGSTHVTWQLLPAMKLINGASLSRPIEIDPTGGGASPSAYYSGILLENIAFSGFADGVYLKRCHGTTIRNLNGSGANSTLHMVDMFVAHIEGGTYAGALDHPSIILEGIKNDSFTNIHIHDLTLIGSGIYTYSSVTSTPYNQWDTIHIHDILQESAVGKYAAVWTVGDALYLKGTLLRNIQMADVITGSFTLTEVANAAGGTTVYTGTITGGAADAFAGRIYQTSGFATAANNGKFLCTASTTTTLTLKNPSGVAEVHAGTATLRVPLVHLAGSAYLNNTEVAGAYNAVDAFFDSAGNSRANGFYLSGYVTTTSGSVGNPVSYHYRDEYGNLASNGTEWVGENASAYIADYYKSRFNVAPSNTQTGIRIKVNDTNYSDALRVQDTTGNNLMAIGGDGILNGPKVKGSLQLEQLASPGTPTVTPTGGAATSWGYKITAYDILGYATAASAEGTTAAGAATLSASAYNTITWNVSPNCSYYKVNRTTAGGAPATTGNIAIVPCIREAPYQAKMTYVDNGIAILDANAPPTVNWTAGLGLGSLVYAALPAADDGTLYYCSDCTKATPCNSGGTGAVAKKINGAWDCD